MNLTHLQFEILCKIERHQNKKHSQRSLSKLLSISLGVVNKVIVELIDLELLKCKENSYYDVTLKGYEWLEPYRVKRALFMAAGFGSRLVPITLNTPKPLINVHGKRIIDTLLDAVLATGINDITVVRGYLGEQFDVLTKKYPMIKFIENPIYNEANNIASAYVSKELFDNAYVFDSDLIVYNPEIIRKYEYTSCYLAKKVPLTDDWCFDTHKGVITKVNVGGRNTFQMYGVSYWNSRDGKQLQRDIELVYNHPGGKEKFWDEVALTVCKDNYQLRIREVMDGDIIEIDTFKELKNLDPIYNI